MLPTDKDAALFTSKEHPELLQLGDNTYNNPNWQGQHIYFTAPTIYEDHINGEKIKDGDWFISGVVPQLLQCSERCIALARDRKVTNTTNPDLLCMIYADSKFLGSVDKEFIRWYVEKEGLIDAVTFIRVQ